MTHRTFLLLAAIGLGACNGSDETLTSEPTDPTRSFDVDLPDEDTDWPIDRTVDPPMDDVPFAGDWVDGWDIVHEITDTRWIIDDSTFDFVEVDADEQHIIAENDADNPYFPGKFSRFDWTVVDDVTWYCQTAFDADDADAARATTAADNSDPATGGCAGFAWSRLYAPLPIRGAWTDGWGTSHDVREWAWTSGDSTFDVTAYDAEAGWLVAQNASTNTYNPDLWSRFEWTVVDDAVWFCQIAYDAETEADALAAGPADTTDPSAGGCGGFAWSALTPAE